MQVRALSALGCIFCTIETLTAGVDTIAASVGRGGFNRRADVWAVQRQLNGVEPGDGGPKAILVEDGVVGPLTDRAILDFQTAQNVQTARNAPVRGDRIDRGGPTWRRLKALSTPRQRSVGDVADEAQVKAMIDSVVAEFGRLDCQIASNGDPISRPMTALTHF